MNEQVKGRNYDDNRATSGRGYCYSNSWTDTIFNYMNIPFIIFSKSTCSTVCKSLDEGIHGGSNMTSHEYDGHDGKTALDMGIHGSCEHVYGYLYSEAIYHNENESAVDDLILGTYPPLAIVFSHDAEGTFYWNGNDEDDGDDFSRAYTVTEHDENMIFDYCRKMTAKNMAMLLLSYMISQIRLECI